MYVAVKGGEKAIRNAHKLLAHKRRGDKSVPDIALEQIQEQLSYAVDRVMTEGSIYDKELAALAIKQAQGDLPEAIFMLRAYRTTLPRFGATEPLETGTMYVHRRVSATFKDMPGGQVLGPTFDYTHRLLDFSLAEIEADGINADPPKSEAEHSDYRDGVLPRVIDILQTEGMLEAAPPSNGEKVGDLTRDPLTFPVSRDVRLQNLARGDEGFILCMGYSTQRGYGNNHPFAGEVRVGDVALTFTPPELGFPVDIGQVTVTECEMINQFKGSDEVPPQFTRGYGLAFGYSERKAMAMSLVDRSLRAGELGEIRKAPAQDEEFVLSHTDSVEASGFVTHLKLPHYVDFQAELILLRQLQIERVQRLEKKERAQTTEAAE